MANLLIGSSNLARFYKPEIFKDFRQYQMMKCTTMDSFNALMMEIEAGKNRVVISVLENIIVDSADSAKTEETMDKKIKDSIKMAFSLIQTTSTRLPDSKFCIVMPLRRPAVEWYEEKLGLIEDEIKCGISSLTSFNVTRINCICTSLQQFDKDGIHLTEGSGVIFLESILKSSEEIFEAIQVPDDVNDQSPDDLKGLITILKTRFEADNMMFARLREEVDSSANKSREDRVVVTGITCKEPLPRENRQKIEKLKSLVAEIFAEIKPGFEGKILYASQGRNDQTFPTVEVKLDKVEYAVAIRKAFADKKKKGKMTGCLERVFLSNSINVGTRVRIEILKSIAKKISNDKEFAFVASFISRPVLHIRQKNDRNEKPSRSYTFIDAIKQFGTQLQKTDLLDAYAKAGKAFAGQLEQNFVVLKESDSEEAQTNFHKARMQRGRGGRGGSYRGRGAGSNHYEDPNKTPMGSRGQKRSGEEGESSASKK
jgi:hypothetical protein